MSKRYAELDALRGIAALAVALAHYSSCFSAVATMPFRFPAGSYGVQLFFVISGFVIFMTLGRTKTAAEFAVSRFSRLYPAYWVALVAAYVGLLVCPAPGTALKFHFGELLWNLSMIQGWFAVRNVNVVSWTLLVEMEFYLLMLLLFGFGRLRQAELLGTVWVTLIFARRLTATAVGHPLPEDVTLPATLDYAQLFLAGIVFYRLKTEGHRWWRHLLLAYCLLAQYAASDWQTTAVVAGVFLLFYLFLWGRLGWIACKPLVFAGTISYSLYLIHLPIGFALIPQLRRFTQVPLLQLSIPLLTAIGAATAMTFCIERPAMNYMRRGYRKVCQDGRFRWRFASAEKTG